jgi:cellulose synthase/poly-beta-1,6-N-acetylglucosamine synthase-like glycosyltransferase
MYFQQKSYVPFFYSYYISRSIGLRAPPVCWFYFIYCNRRSVCLCALCGSVLIFSTEAQGTQSFTEILRTKFNVQNQKIRY